MTRKIILASSVLLLAVVATLFAVSPAAAEPTIRWNPRSVEETLQPGQSRVIQTSFTALADVPSAVLRVATSIAPYVTVQPSGVAPVSKGQTIPVTLTVNIPIDALPATTSGAVQLRVAEPHGKKEFGKTIARPLPVEVCVEWGRVEGLPGGIGFSYTTFGAEGTLRSEVTASGTVYNVVEILDPTTSEFEPQYAINFAPNPSRLQLLEWFTQVVDVSGSILAGGQYAVRSLANGLSVLEITGPIPPQHFDVSGPIPDKFALSPSGDRVIAIQTIQGTSLGARGAHESVRQRAYDAILESMTFQ